MPPPSLEPLRVVRKCPALNGGTPFQAPLTGNHFVASRTPRHASIWYLCTSPISCHFTLEVSYRAHGFGWIRVVDMAEGERRGGG